jgi:hypothetical protein
MRPLPVGVRNFARGDSASLLPVGRPIQRKARRLIGPMVALHKGIRLRMVRITDGDLTPQTRPTTDQSGWKITACGTAHEAADRDPG